MAVDTEAAAVRVRSVQHDIVGSDELGPGHDLEAKSEDVPAIHGVRIRVVDLEGGDGGARAVEALLFVGALLCEARDELWPERAAGGSRSENLLRRIRRHQCCRLQPDVAF